MNVSIIETSGLGDRSYLATDGEVAVVVDPQRDIDRVLDLAARTRRADHARAGDPHPQRLRHRRPGARPHHRSRLRGARRQTTSTTNDAPSATAT